ncbi:hypothetical protein BXZ70DRAFT_997404 [Cristinia sonorae]|uniref:Shieldin complex subunit 2 first OB fold domain-containing protein n=1 Tax=Cristinia sonorae TaxID=1940300 RepID=A0A8K0XVD4_9AGAR|nr:hypothetical protein BXZ70DRAFT_997404 [Cristinia sonorae]
MSRFRVFTGAPSVRELREVTGDTKYQWTIASSSLPTYLDPLHTLPPATLASANRRISMLYENIIFDYGSGEEAEAGEHDSILQYSADTGADQTTAITWPPTAEESAHVQQTVSKAAASFLRSSMSASRIRSQVETQETQETGSYDYSDAESIARFPAFHFSLHRVTSLSDLPKLAQEQRRHDFHAGPSLKVVVLVAVLEVDGPDSILLKKGVDAGKNVSILKLIVGDEDGAICRLTAWREVADAWGGSYSETSAPRVKRGDIVLLENVLITSDPTNTSLSLTASPNLKSQMEICFRTMPNTPEDARFRPDLRLGISDSAVRKVSAVVAWFESKAGLR